MDAILECWRRSHERPPRIAPPRRILIANGAHLGDVVLSTSVLPIIKQTFPESQLGFLAGSWATCVLRGHPLVDWLHVVDHWKLNRSPISLSRKLVQFLRTRHRALSVIRRLRYDVAIDLYYFFPNSIPLLCQAGIPIRIGYSSGGFGPLLTHSLEWTDRQCHVTDYHADLLRVLDLSEAQLFDRRLCLPPVDADFVRAFQQKIPRAFLDTFGYCVLHLGTGAEWKEWPEQQWQALVERLLSNGLRLVFTGTGLAEHRKIARVIGDHTGCINLSGELNWPQFVTAIERSRLLIGVDSVAGHVAAAVDTPSVIVGSGITNSAHWRPLHPQSRVLTHSVTCAPCYRSRGCDTMECVRAVSVNEVFHAVQSILSKPKSETLAS